MSMSEVLIYAELLSNIRQVSIIAVLPTPSTSTTTSELSSDRRQFSLLHSGQRTTLTLPGQISARNSLSSKVEVGKTEFSWRLPATEHISLPNAFKDSTVDSPWTAKDLSSKDEFACRECKSVILEVGKLKVWKDLPSENWAEMMEFWHCHKPDVKADQDDPASAHPGHDHSHQDDANAHRGYGANSKFAASEGVGFVDISTFLLADADVKNIKFTDTTSPVNTSSHIPISCASCTSYLGHHDPLSSGLRLYKWRLELTSSSSSSDRDLLSATATFPTARSLPTTLSAMAIHTTTFATTMHSQATSRLLLCPLDPSSSSTTSSPSSTTPRNRGELPPTHLNLWILTPSIHFSATSSPTTSNPNSTTTTTTTTTTTSPPSPSQAVDHHNHQQPHQDHQSKAPTSQHAMKIFYAIPSSPGEIAELRGREGVEEVFLPGEGIVEIWRALKESRRWLPKGTWRFREWDVGLLERF